VFWTTQEAKKASEREREESEGESAPQERQTDDRQTEKDGQKDREVEF